MGYKGAAGARRPDFKKVYIAVFAFIFLFMPSHALRAAALFGILVFALSFAYSALAARGVSAARPEAVIRCYRNEPFSVIIKIENESRFPFTSLLVQDRTGPLRTDMDGRALLSLPGRRKASLAYRAVAPERGEFRVGPLSVMVSDPLGLYPRTIEFPGTAARLIVYPETGRLGLMKPEGIPQGAIKTANPVYEDVTRFRSIRPYVPGDDPRRINWKASARAGSLVTNEYLSSLSAPLMIVLDLDANSYPARYRYALAERAIEAAATLASEAAAQGQPVGFASNGLFSGGQPMPPAAPAPGNGIALMEALAVISPIAARASGGPEPGDAARGDGFGIVPRALSVRLPGRCRIAFIGPLPGESDAAALLRAKEGGLSPELYLVDPRRTQRRSAYSSFFQVFALSESGYDLAER